MNTSVRLLILVIILNVVRYVIGGAIEQFTIMEPMHRVMPQFPECFSEFSVNDFVISLLYNFVMWFAATLAFHKMHPSLGGPMILRSLQSFGIMCLFFIGLAAVYMNHFTDPIKPFFLWSMVDALIVFAVVGLAAGLIYPFFFRKKMAERQPEQS